MNVERIVVVGGGSSGWMTASLLIKSFPNKEIVVIESPDVPRVGVGESTYDGIQRYIKLLDIDMKSFFAHTDANLKLAIRLSDFYTNSHTDDFIYPFGMPDANGTTWGLDDWHIKKYLYPNTPNQEYAEAYFPAAAMVKYNTFSENTNSDFGSFVPARDTAYHFDAIKFAEWLKNHYALPRGVQYISENVVEVNTSERGVDSIVLADGHIVSADLFVDCTGFKSMLLGEALEVPFISYNDVLPNNRAWATQIDYIDKERELEAVTTATAIGNGWVWNIPLWSRIGTGYVYSDEFISPEDALEEFKTNLVEKMGRTREYLDSLTYKDIKMRVGTHEKTFVKNVVAIGLSAGFIEPLESNGLFSVHEFLFQLIRALDRGVVSQWDRDVYNHSTLNIFRGFVEFIQMHYALSIRSDTPYWQANLERQYDFDNYTESRHMADHLFKLKTEKTKGMNPAKTGAGTWIATGYNYPVLDRTAASLGEMHNNVDYRTQFQNPIAHLDNRRLRWEKAAKAATPLIDYLRDTYHADSEQRNNDEDNLSI